MIRAALQAAPPGNPFAGLAAGAVRRWLGRRAGALEVARAQELLARSLQPGTGINYRSWLQRYLDFCGREALSPLPAARTTIYRFVVHLASTLAATSVRRYLSAVLSLHRDTGHPAPVGPGDPFLTRLLRGRVAEEGAARPQTVGPALPAAAVWAVLQHALAAPDVDVLRAATAVVVTFRTVSRSQTTLLAAPGDIWVEHLPPPGELACRVCGSAARDEAMVLCDRCDGGFHFDCMGLGGVPAGDWSCEACRAPGAYPVAPYESRVLALRASHAKGRSHAGVGRVRRYGLGGCPDAAALVERFAAAADALWARHRGRGTRRFFFQLPRDPPGWRPSALLSSWLQAALESVGWPGQRAHFSSHSIRRGAASAASAAGVPRAVLEGWGEWSAGSAALARRYVDPAVGPSPAGRAFFLSPLVP